MPYDLAIPEKQHPKIIYGAHWTGQGNSGYYIRLTDEDQWLKAATLPTLTWAEDDNADSYDLEDDEISLAMIQEEFYSIADDCDDGDCDALFSGDDEDDCHTLMSELDVY